MSYESVNFPQPFAVLKMAEYHETFITSLAARPGSAPILAIIERIRSGVFAFSFGFVGFSSKFARVSSLHFDIVIDLNVKDISLSSLTCAF